MYKLIEISQYRHSDLFRDQTFNKDDGFISLSKTWTLPQSHTIDSRSRYDVSLRARRCRSALFAHNDRNYLGATLSAMNHLLTWRNACLLQFDVVATYLGWRTLARCIIVIIRR